MAECRQAATEARESAADEDPGSTADTELRFYAQFRWYARRFQKALRATLALGRRVFGRDTYSR